MAFLNSEIERFKSLNRPLSEKLSLFKRFSLSSFKLIFNVLSSSELYQFEVGAISEDKALKVLERVKMLRKLREDIIVHPDLKSRLKKCEQALDLPEWWVTGKHDRDLLFGVAR